MKNLLLFFHDFNFTAADLSAIKAGKEPKPKKTRMGRCLGDTLIQFDKAETSCLNLVGKSKGFVKFSRRFYFP